MTEEMKLCMQIVMSMYDKLEWKKAEGFTGWQDPIVDELIQGFNEHAEKDARLEDPENIIDMINFLAFIYWHRMKDRKK